MQWWTWLLISLGTFLAIYASFFAWLVSHGRDEDARALATFSRLHRARDAPCMSRALS